MKFIKKLIPKKLKEKIKKSLGSTNSFMLNDVVNQIADRKIALMMSQAEYKRFSDKVVVVTGATGSIGKDLCRDFAKEGANVIVCGRNEKKVNAVVEEITSNGGKAFSCIFNITDAKQIETAFEKIVEEHKRIDVLLNCAGGSARNSRDLLANQSVEVIDEMISLNLRAPLLCSKYASAQMIRQNSGCIINFSSLMSLRGKEGYVEYGASKAGVDGLTRALSVELGKHNIRVNSVTPSYIPCEEITENRFNQLKASNFLGSVSASSDISAAVLFLSSDEAGFITGQNLVIDGGRSLGLKGD